MNLLVSEFRARGYRSLKSIAYPMSGLDVFVGANGVGKTNLYRTLELLRSAAANTLAGDLAREGGLSSALWAGPRRRGEPARLRLAAAFADPAGRRPGSTLHPDLMEPLASLIVQAADRARLWLVTHSERLATAVTATGAGKVRHVVKQDGETRIEGLKAWGAFEDEE